MRTLFGMGLMALSLSAQAAISPSVIKVQSTITDLAFQLTDLTPQDGIAPSFVPFDNYTQTNVSTSWYRNGSPFDSPVLRDGSQSNVFAGALFNSSTVGASLVSGQADASKSGNVLTSSVDVKASSFEGAIYPSYRGSWLGQNSFNSSVGVDPKGWLLAPGSEVTITGSIHASLAVNTDGVVGFTDGKVLEVGGSSRSYVYLEIPGLDSGAPSQWEREDVRISGHQLVSPTGSWSSANANALSDKTFSLTARNTGTSTILIGLSAGSESYGYWSVADVPESSTWAFGLVGLGVISVCLRRRRT